MNFFKEHIKELRKMRWATRKEVFESVAIVLVVCGLLVGLYFLIDIFMIWLQSKI